MLNFSLVKFFEKVDAGSLIHTVLLIVVPVLAVVAILAAIYVIGSVGVALKLRRDRAFLKAAGQLPNAGVFSKGGI